MAELIAKRGRLSVNELAEEYAVTTETVRRDLSVLERGGIIRRVHGGAVPAESLTVLETAVSDRDLARSEEKDRIAKAALDFLPPAGGSILLDAGTSTARLATYLPRDHALTVVTNAVPIAARLAGARNVDLHLLPGRVRRTTQAAVGDDTVAALHQLRPDVAFVGTNGISLDHGFSTPDHSEAAAKRAMVRAGRRVVVLADSSKVGLENTVRFAELTDVDVLVTDSGISKRDVNALRQRDVEVVIA
ncbi:MAG TPA: DeoR/GlpR family DNA-binding transcription regulator [Nocardioidaceae bacterium]|nr:DeoR/GlpR family DNA-binding transcription regulator [Nocardioidaceae bacterium]